MDRLLLPRVRLEPDGVEHPIPEAGSPLPRWQTLPMDAKFPVNPAPKGEVTFVTTKICQPAYKSAQRADFDLTDPYNRTIKSEYKSLHDPLLKEWFSKPHLRQQLVQQNLITESGNVSCSVKDFNDYRYFLRQKALVRPKTSPGEDQTALARRQHLLQERKLKAEVFGVEVKYKLLKARQTSRELDAEKRRKFEEKKVQEEERLKKWEDGRRKSVNKDKQKSEDKLEQMKRRDEKLRRKAAQKLQEFESDAQRRLNIIDNIREQRFYQLDLKKKDAWRKKREVQLKALEEADRAKRRLEAEVMKAKKQYEEKMIKSYAKDQAGILCKMEEKEKRKVERNQIFAKRMTYALEGTDKKTLWDVHQLTTGSTRARMWLVEEVLDRLGLLPIHLKEKYWHQLLSHALNETVKKLEMASVIGEEQQLISDIIHILIRQIQDFSVTQGEEDVALSKLLPGVDVTEETQKAVRIAMTATFDLPAMPQADVALGGDLHLPILDKSYFEKREHFFTTKMKLTEADVVAMEEEVKQFLEFLKTESLSNKDVKSILKLFLMLANHEKITKPKQCDSMKRNMPKFGITPTERNTEAAIESKPMVLELPEQSQPAHTEERRLDIGQEGDSVDLERRDAIEDENLELNEMMLKAGLGEGAVDVGDDDDDVDEEGIRGVDDVNLPNEPSDHSGGLDSEKVSSPFIHDIRPPDDSEFEYAKKDPHTESADSIPPDDPRSEDENQNKEAAGSNADDSIKPPEEEESNPVDGIEYNQEGGSLLGDGSIEYNQQDGLKFLDDQQIGKSSDYDPNEDDVDENEADTENKKSAENEAASADPGNELERSDEAMKGPRQEAIIPEKQMNAEQESANPMSSNVAKKASLAETELSFKTSYETTAPRASALFETEEERRLKEEAEDETLFNQLVEEEDIVAVTQHFLNKFQETEHTQGVSFPPHRIHQFIALNMSKLWSRGPQKHEMGEWLQDEYVSEIAKSLINNLTKCRLPPDLLRQLAICIVGVLMVDMADTNKYLTDSLVRCILNRFLKDLQHNKVTLAVVELTLKVILEEYSEYMETHIDFKFDNFLMEVLGQAHDMLRMKAATDKVFVKAIRNFEDLPPEKRSFFTVADWSGTIHKVMVVLRLGLVPAEQREVLKQTFMACCQTYLEEDYDEESLDECIETLKSRFEFDPKLKVSAIIDTSANVTAVLHSVALKNNITSLTLLPGALNMSQSACVEPEPSTLASDHQCESIVFLLLDKLAQDLNHSSLSLQVQSRMAASLVDLLVSDFHCDKEVLLTDGLKQALDDMTLRFRSRVLGFKECVQVFGAVLRPFLAAKIVKHQALSSKIDVGHPVDTMNEDLSRSLVTLLTECYLTLVSELKKRSRRPDAEKAVSSSILALYIWRTLAKMAIAAKFQLEETVENKVILKSSRLDIESLLSSVMIPDPQTNTSEFNIPFLESVIAMATRPGFVPVHDRFLEMKTSSSVTKDEDPLLSQPTIPSMEIVITRECIKAVKQISQCLVTPSACTKMRPKVVDFYVSSVFVLHEMVSLLYQKLWELRRNLIKKKLKPELIVNRMCEEQVRTIPPLEITEEEAKILITRAILELEEVNRSLKTLARMAECLTRMGQDAGGAKGRPHTVLSAVTPSLTTLLIKSCSLSVLRVLTGVLAGDLDQKVVDSKPVDRVEQYQQVAAIVVLHNSLASVRDEVDGQSSNGLWSPTSGTSSVLELPMSVVYEVYEAIGQVIDLLTTKLSLPDRSTQEGQGSLVTSDIANLIINKIMSSIAYRVEIGDVPPLRVNDLVRSQEAEESSKSISHSHGHTFENSSDNKPLDRSGNNHLADPALRLQQDMHHSLLNYLSTVLCAIEKGLKDQIETAILANESYEAKIQARVFIDVAKEKVNFALKSKPLTSAQQTVVMETKTSLTLPGDEANKDVGGTSVSGSICTANYGPHRTDFTNFVTNLFKSIVDQSTKEEEELIVKAELIQELICACSSVSCLYLAPASSTGRDSKRNSMYIIILEMMLHELFTRQKQCKKFFKESILQKTAMPYLSIQTSSKPDPLGPHYAEVLDRERRLSNFIHSETNAVARKFQSRQTSVAGSATRCDNSVFEKSSSSLHHDKLKAEQIRGHELDVMTSKRIAHRVSEWRRNIMTTSAANNAESTQSSSSLWRKNFVRHVIESKEAKTTALSPPKSKDKWNESPKKTLTENFANMDSNANKSEQQASKPKQSAKSNQINSKLKKEANSQLLNKTKLQTPKTLANKPKQPLKHEVKAKPKPFVRKEVTKKAPVRPKVTSGQINNAPKRLPRKRTDPFKDGSWKKAHAQREERSIEVIYHVSSKVNVKPLDDTERKHNKDNDAIALSVVVQEKGAADTETKKDAPRQQNLVQHTLLTLLAGPLSRTVKVVRDLFCQTDLTTDQLADLLLVIEEAIGAPDLEFKKRLLQGEGQRSGISERLTSTVGELITSLETNKLTDEDLIKIIPSGQTIEAKSGCFRTELIASLNRILNRVQETHNPVPQIITDRWQDILEALQGADDEDGSQTFDDDFEDDEEESDGSDYSRGSKVEVEGLGEDDAHSDRESGENNREIRHRSSSTSSSATSRRSRSSRSRGSISKRNATGSRKSTPKSRSASSSKSPDSLRSRSRISSRSRSYSRSPDRRSDTSGVSKLSK
ncbi:fibrous sheath-interacting protein 2, partial [Biomphalaria glabrata]